MARRRRVRQVTIALAAIGLVFVFAACGGRQPRIVPDLRGERLDVAQDRLEKAGLAWDTSGGGVVGVVVRSHWRVCDQDPKPGAKATSVLLIVDRSCHWTVPNVLGLRLDEAEKVLDNTGMPYQTATGEGQRPQVARLWKVCAEEPTAGVEARWVELVVARTCDVPEVVGLALPAAEEVLEQGGVPSEATTPEGARPLVKSGWSVCRQSPGPGERADLVVLSVARSCAPVIPDVELFALDEAEETLDAAGIAYEELTADGQRPRIKWLWTVCDQDPEFGARGSSVSLYVARNCYEDWPGLLYEE